MTPSKPQDAPRRITLEKLEPHSYAMAVGDKRHGARYNVSLNGVHIGEVEKCSSPTYRSEQERFRSNIRWGFMGYGIRWSAKKVNDFQTVTDNAYSRQQAIQRLVEASR